MKLHNDGFLWFYAVIGLAACAASAPATFAMVLPFHRAASADMAAWAPIASGLAWVLLLEVGTIAAKLATVFVPSGRGWLQFFCVAGLVVNGVSNYLHAYATAATWGIKDAGLYVGAFLYGAWAPAIVYLMLSLLCARLVILRGPQYLATQQVTAVLQPVESLVTQYNGLMAAIASLRPAPVSAPVSALPAVQTFARPAEHRQAVAVSDTGAAASYVCKRCGASVPLQPGKNARKVAAVSGRWGCSMCNKASAQ